jgi:hypothetical protein
MVCRIKIPGDLKDKTNGETIAEIEGATVGECIERVPPLVNVLKHWSAGFQISKVRYSTIRVGYF